MISGAREFAVELSRRAGDLIRYNFDKGPQRTWKSDNSPLTVTDLAVNDLVISSVAAAYPHCSVVGEERSLALNTDSEWAWVCDPIDGTLSFAHGYPQFTFSLGLTRFGKSVLGIIYDPIMDRMFIGEQGKGSVMNGRPISVSNSKSLKTTVVDLEIVTEELLRDGPLRQGLKDHGALVVSLYSGAYAGSLVAMGQFASVIYGHRSQWDACALDVIIREAGGHVTDFDGAPLSYTGPLNGFVASNGAAHGIILGIVGPNRKR